MQITRKRALENVTHEEAISFEAMQSLPPFGDCREGDRVFFAQPRNLHVASSFKLKFEGTQIGYDDNDEWLCGLAVTVTTVLLSGVS